MTIKNFLSVIERHVNTILNKTVILGIVIKSEIDLQMTGGILVVILMCSIRRNSVNCSYFNKDSEIDLQMTGGILVVILMCSIRRNSVNCSYFNKDS